jgi:hypothetical protein
VARATLSHTLHDLGLAAWFGGTLANAVALNRAASGARGPDAVGAVANEGWDNWTPVNAAAIGAHLAGSVGILQHDLGRMGAQKGVGSMAAVKTTLTVAALGVTAYSRALGRKVSQHRNDVPAESGTEPSVGTPPDKAEALKELKVLQWAVPALTGALVAVSAFASEQFRPEEVQRGIVKRVLS